MQTTSRAIQQLSLSRQHPLSNHQNQKLSSTYAYAPYRRPNTTSSSSSSSSRTAANGLHARQQQTASGLELLLQLQTQLQQQHAVGPAQAAITLEQQRQQQQHQQQHQQHQQQQRQQQHHHHQHQQQHQQRQWPVRKPITRRDQQRVHKQPATGLRQQQQGQQQVALARAADALRQQQQQLGQQLLQQATSPAAAALTPGQACAVLHACALLQLAPPAPTDLLLQLLRIAVPAAAALPAVALLQLLQGAAWLLDCPQQQPQHSLAPSEAASEAAPPAAAPPTLTPQKQQRPLSPQQQHAMLEAKRQQLLQRSSAPLRQPQQGGQQQQQQQQHSAVRQLLQEALSAWCEAQQVELTATSAACAVLPQQLSQLLSVLLKLRLLPGAVCLQQLLFLAGLQQQQQLLWPAGDAAGVLAGLVALAQLEQNSSSTAHVLGVVQQHAEQLLLLAIDPLASQAPGPTGAEQTLAPTGSPALSQQQQHWPGVVALTAACDLLTLTSSSSSSSDSAAGAAAKQQPQAVFSPLALRTAMGVLLAAVVRPTHSAQHQQQGQQQGQQQQQPLQAMLSPADVVASASAAHTLYQHQQQWSQHQLQSCGHPADCEAAGTSSSNSSRAHPSGAAADGRVVKPLRFQLWLPEFVACGLHPTESQASAPQLISVFGLCVAVKAVVPPWWLGEAEDRVSGLLQELCAGDKRAVAGQEFANVASAARLLHSWVQLLEVQPNRRPALTSSCPSSSSGGGMEAAVLPGASDGSYSHSHSSSSSSGSSRDLYEPYFLRSSWFMREACSVLQPVLSHMDAASLGLTAVSVSQLGVPQELRQTWVDRLLAAAAAAADRASGPAAGAGAEAQAGAPADGQSAAAQQAQAAAAAAAAVPAGPSSPAAGEQQGHRLPGEAVVHLLQSLVLLRTRPSAALLQRLLALLRRDMVLERGPVLVGLLVVLTQLQYRPGAEWLRAVLLRLQGRLRLLSFDQLTQLCWCLMLLGVQPPQHWLDDFMDAAAVHIIAERSRQQQWDAWRKQQQQQQQQEGEQVPPLLPRPRPGAPVVHPWQLRLMHWVSLRVWRYRSTYLHGKLQWRAVRELNRAVWRQPPQRALQQLQAQWQQAQSAHAGRARTRRHSRMVLSAQEARLRWLVEVRKAKGQAVQRSRRVGRQQERLVQEHAGLQDSSSWAQQRQHMPRRPEPSSSASSSGGSSVAVKLSGRQRRAASSGSSGTLAVGSTLRRRWQVTGRAQWADPTLWPKQWQLATLPSQQHQRIKGVRLK